MSQKFIVGNWKMNATTSEASRLAEAIVDGVAFEGGVSVAVCPPFRAIAPYY